MSKATKIRKYTNNRNKTKVSTKVRDRIEKKNYKSTISRKELRRPLQVQYLSEQRRLRKEEEEKKDITTQIRNIQRQVFREQPLTTKQLRNQKLLNIEKHIDYMNQLRRNKELETAEVAVRGEGFINIVDLRFKTSDMASKRAML